MKLLFFAGISIALAAQSVVTQKSMSLALAKTIAEATLAECKAKGFSTSAFTTAVSSWLTTTRG